MIGATSHRISAEIARQSALSKAIARGQSDISSKTRLQVGSDDPAASAQVAGIRRTQANEAAWAKNVDAGAATATRVDAGLEATATVLDRAREAMVAARNGTQYKESRAVLAAELAGMADDVAMALTAKDTNGRDLFPSGEPLKLPIGQGVAIAATVSREAAFGDMEAMLRAAAQAVADGDDAAMATSLDAIAARSDALAEVRGQHGVRAARLDAARESLAVSTGELGEERALLEGTDLAATVATLQSNLLTLDAAQAVFAKLNAKSLFNLL